jgi:membrane-associated phospholipid phosphatase
MGNTFRENSYFFIPFLIFCALFTILLGIYTNANLFLFVNRHDSYIADFIFLYWTNLGDGIIAVMFIVALLWISFRDALTFLVITLLITVIVNILKDRIFPEMNRPVPYFGTSQVLHLVSGYKPPKLSTFPSGHTTTAFSVGLYITFLIKKRGAKFLLFLTAFFVGYSRMYLSAHFPLDVLVGALIGVLITLLCYFPGRMIKSSWMDKKIKYAPKLFVRKKSV